MKAIQSQLLFATRETHAHKERADGAPARSAGVASALLYQRVTSATTKICPQITFLTLDRERQRRLRLASYPAALAALHAEKKTRRWCIAHGYCVAYYTHDRKFFTWHFYRSQAEVLAHLEYLHFAFRAQGGCPPIAKLRLRGRVWTVAEKLAFQRRAYGL